MNNLLTLSYWFNLNPGPFLGSYLRMIYFAIILFLIAGVVSWIFIKKNNQDVLTRRFWQKIQTFCFAIGAIAWILVFARQQRIIFIGMPFFFILFFICALMWLFFIIKYLVITIPQRKKEQQAKAAKEKYLNR